MALVLTENGVCGTGIIEQLDVRILIAEQHDVTILSVPFAAHDIAFAYSFRFKTLCLWTHKSCMGFPFQVIDFSFLRS
jgi:hypothetical protein